MNALAQWLIISSIVLLSLIISALSVLLISPQESGPVDKKKFWSFLLFRRRS